MTHRPPQPAAAGAFCCRGCGPFLSSPPMSDPRGDGHASADEPQAPAGSAAQAPLGPAREAPPIAARSTRGFGRVFLLTAALWVLLLPVASLLFVNRYDSYEVNFVQGLYVRKHVA